MSSPPRPAWQSPRVLAAIALGLGWAAAFLPLLLSDSAPFYRDQLLTALPLRDYLSARLRHFELPQWYPYEALGVPFIGQVVTATFHPFSVLLLPFSTVMAVKLQTALSYLLGSIGTYKAARALGVSRAAAMLAAFAFELGGYSYGVSHNPVYLLAHATLPWVMWSAIRVAQRPSARHVAALSVSWALVFLAGDAQAFALCPLLMLVALLVAREGPLRPKLIALVSAAALSALLISAELLPAMALSRSSIRVLGTSDPMLGRLFSFHPLRLFELFVSNPYPDELRFEVTQRLFHDGGALWATTVFAGTTVMVLAIVGAIGAPRVRWPLAAVSLLGLWLAMGDHGGLLPLLWKLAPPLTWFRFPEKYASFFWIGLPLLAAFGLDEVRKRRRAGWVGFAAVIACAAALLLAASSIASSVFTDARIGGEVQAAWLHGLIGAVAFSAAGLLVVLGSAKRDRLLFAFPALVWVELMLANSPHLPLAPVALLEEEPPFASALHQLAPEGLPRAIPVAGGRAKRTVTGSDVHWAAVMRQLLRADESGRSHIGSLFFNLPVTHLRAWRALGPQASLRAQMGPLFNGCFRVLDENAPVAADDQLLLKDSAQQLTLTSTSCRPRVYLSSALALSEKEAQQRTLAGLPPELSVWEGDSDLPKADGSVRLEEDAPERLVLRVKASESTALIVNDQLSPGWDATLDGGPVPMAFANIAVRGVKVPGGDHRVEMAYRTPRLVPGLILTLLGWLVVVALLVVGRESRRPTRA